MYFEAKWDSKISLGPGCEVLYLKWKFLVSLAIFLLWICRYPFDWKNPIGYFVAVTFQYISAVYLFTFTNCLIFFGIGSFIFEHSATNDLKNDLKSSNGIVKIKRKRAQVLDRVSDFIQFYSKLKQLSLRVDHITIFM